MNIAHQLCAIYKNRLLIYTYAQCDYASHDLAYTLDYVDESGSFRSWVVSAWVVSAIFWGGSFRPK